MTLMPVPPIAQAPQTALRPVEHPDLSGVLTHFCYRGRPQPFAAVEVQGMTARQRLESILWESRLRGFVTFSGGDPAVCFTEATVGGLDFLLARRSYHPWGLVFDRQSVYDAGGGPVWYARPDEYTFLGGLCRSGAINSRLQSWLVRLEPASSDWLEEQEWRIPLIPAPEPALQLQALRLAALLVGDPGWSPARDGWGAEPATGTPIWTPLLPGLLVGVPRWWWNPTEGRLCWLSPLA